MNNNASLKLNDLSNSSLRKRFIEQTFVPNSFDAIAFGRVSTKKQQDQGNSDLAQLESIEEYAKKEKLNIVQVWDVAETASKNNKRTKFHEMLAFVRANENVRHIIFSHQSRANRNRESARDLEALLNLGITIHFSRERRKLTCKSDIEDLLLWDVNNILNEKFIRDHTKNVMDGMVKRIEMGLFPCKAPYGYKNFRGEDQLSVFKFDPNCAPYAKRAFELFATGNFSEPALKKQLDNEFPEVKKKPNPKFFGKLLRNPFYYGDFWYDGMTYRGNPKYHPALVSFTLWSKVQDVLNNPGRSKQKVITLSHPYIGLVKCGGKIIDDQGNETDVDCNCSVTAEEKRKKLANGDIKRFYYYRCSNTSKACSQRNIGFLRSNSRSTISYNISEIEDLFLAVFQPLNFTPEVAEWMQNVLRAQHKEKSRDHLKRLSALQARFTTLENFINRSYEDKLDGSITEDLWREKNNDWLKEREAVKVQIDLISADKDDYIEKGVLLIELVQRTEMIYKNGTPEVKRKLIDAVSSNHRLRNGSIEFNYKKPFDILAKTQKVNVVDQTGIEPATFSLPARRSTN